MRVTKPESMSLLFRTNLFNQQNILTISTFATFTFANNEPRLLEEKKLWEVVEQNLAKDEIFDAGQPKHRGEYLVYGNAYSSNPVVGLGVYVQVANLSKTLVVVGNRHWTKTGASAPEPFTEMPINSSYAYGGKKFALNPKGKGIDADDTGKIHLPNLENPDNPIIDRNSRPEPSYLCAHAIDAMQRNKHLGKIDADYLTKDWPGMPSDTNPEYFNTAPEDQRLNGFFKGSERFVIKNMHREQPTLNSQLPNIRLRLFIIQKEDNGEKIFKELKNNAETLWLFPNQEIGALLFRANLNVADDEYSDVSKLFAVWEPLNELPKSLEFYCSYFLAEQPLIPEELATAETDSDKAELQPEKIIVTDAPNKSLKDESANDHEFTNVMNEINKIQHELDAHYKKLGLNKEQETQKLLQGTSVNNVKNISDDEIINEITKLQKDLDKTISNNPSAKKLLDTISSPNLTPSSTLPDATILAQMPNEFKDKFNALLKQLQVGIEDNQKDAQNNPLVKPEDKPPQLIKTPILQTVQATKPTREDIITMYNYNRDLSNLDLSGLDLSTLDLNHANFTNSNLSGTNLSNSVLSSALFDNCIMLEVNLSNSNLDYTKISNSYLSKSNFKDSLLNNTTLTNCDISNSDFTGSQCKRARLENINLESSNLIDTIFSETLLINCLLVGCDLSNANFSSTQLVNVELTNANLEKANFKNINSSNLKLEAAYGSNTDFSQSNLSGVRADAKTRLYRVDLRKSNLTYAAIEGAQFIEANLQSAVLDFANCSKTNFTKAKLELASAKETNFSKASLESANLNRINLFKGSLRNANLINSDIRYSNLYGVDFYKASTGNTNLIGANLNATLLSIHGITPKII